MRTNGEMRVQIILDGGLDGRGEPLPPAVEWSEAVPCHIAERGEASWTEYEDGACRRAGYSVLAEPRLVAGALPPCAPVRRVRLSRLGEELGEFAVAGASPLETQGRLRITV